MSEEVREHSAETKSAYEGGATRSSKVERYDQIPPQADRAMAYRFGLGVLKHGEGNWKQGGADFIKQCLNHGRGHVGLFIEKMGQPSPAQAKLKDGTVIDIVEDDLGAILWNYAALAWFRERKPEEFAKAMAELDEGVTG